MGVNAAYEHGGVVLGGSRHYNVFCAGVDVTLGFFLCEEEAGGLNNVFSTYCTPGDFCGVLACCYADVLAVYNQFALFEVVVNGSVELAVHCVILQHVSHVVNGKKVVDSDYFDVVALGGGTEDEATDATETIDTYFSHSFEIEYWVVCMCLFYCWLCPAWGVLRRVCAEPLPYWPQN